MTAVLLAGEWVRKKITDPRGAREGYFGYDPLGRCVKRWVGNSGHVYSNPATYFHYDGWNMLQEGANAWGPARVYVHGSRVDEIVWSYNTFTGEQAFHHYDARGHCTLLTDSVGGVLEQYEYDAFGVAYFYDAAGTPIIVNGQAGSIFGNRFLFQGREWLSDLKLYDYRNRLYQPELGRFLQPDPKEFAAGHYNLYRYCHNDPVNKTDPTGLDPSALKWSNDAKRIELKPTGNWGDRTSSSYYKEGLTREGQAVEGKTKLGLTELKAHPDGGVTGNLYVDSHVLPSHKGDLVDKREQDHPKLAREFLKDVSNDALHLMVNDDKVYNSMRDFAEGRKEYVQKLYDAMVIKQHAFDEKNAPHDYSRPEFHQ